MPTIIPVIQQTQTILVTQENVRSRIVSNGNKISEKSVALAAITLAYEIYRDKYIVSHDPALLTTELQGYSTLQTVERLGKKRSLVPYSVFPIMEKSSLIEVDGILVSGSHDELRQYDGPNVASWESMGSKPGKTKLSARIPEAGSLIFCVEKNGEILDYFTTSQEAIDYVTDHCYSPDDSPKDYEVTERRYSEGKESVIRFDAKVTERPVHSAYITYFKDLGKDKTLAPYYAVMLPIAISRPTH